MWFVASGGQSAVVDGGGNGYGSALCSVEQGRSFVA